ncbi:MAG: hypothetical protein HOW73_12800 [Polyangiaceae bacterium]|nr:hypothetical protein [Polyangiaceae bacterium]
MNIARLRFGRLGIVALLGLTSACASSDLMTEIKRPKIAANEQKATVVFLRASSTAPNTTVTILDDKRRFLGDSLPGGCFVAQVDPGEHLFVGWAANTTAMEVSLEPKKIYYVDVVMRLGSVSARANLLRVDTSAEAKRATRAALSDCTFYRADERAGARWLAEREPEAIDRVRRAKEIAARYTTEEQKQRRLLPEDGRSD